MEGLTHDVITVVANTLANVTGAWDKNIGHPNERKDQAQENEDTLTPDLMDQLVQLMSPLEQHNTQDTRP